MSDDKLTVVLNTELAHQMAEPDFMELMQTLSAYEVQSANVKVTNDAEYQMCVDSQVAIDRVAKALETKRKAIVAYPNTFTTTVNATFRSLKSRSKKVKEKLAYHSKKYKDKKDAEYAKQQAELAAVQQQEAEEVQPEVIQFDEDGSQVAPEVPNQAPTPPLQTTKTSDGQGSVSYRKGPPNVEVVNVAKLVRAAISDKNKVPGAIVTVDMKELRSAVNAGIYTVKQWAKYGVKVTETQQQVIRG